MNKGLIIGIIIVVVIALIGLFSISTYNELVDKSEEVENKYSDISVQLERRADLIPNLVSTVKGYVLHEDSAIEKVTSSREKLVNAKSVNEKALANQELTSSLNSLFAIAEDYPDLKANTNFIQLQDELAGTENRIAVARKDYNEAIKEYNQTIKKFPTSVFAGMFNFEKKEYFEAKDSANEVPNVSFED